MNNETSNTDRSIYMCELEIDNYRTQLCIIQKKMSEEIAYRRELINIKFNKVVELQRRNLASGKSSPASKRK